MAAMGNATVAAPRSPPPTPEGTGKMPARAAIFNFFDFSDAIRYMPGVDVGLLAKTLASSLSDLTRVKRPLLT